jgi:methyl-accepting chemotaxis protein
MAASSMLEELANQTLELAESAERLAAQGRELSQLLQEARRFVQAAQAEVPGIGDSAQSLRRAIESIDGICTATQRVALRGRQYAQDVTQ